MQKVSENKEATKWGEYASSTELGYPIHVGLRKGCDSTQSSLVWNLAHCFDKPWNVYLECAWKRLLAVPDADAFRAAKELKRAVEDFNDTVRGGDANIRESMSFYFALDMLHDSDWEGISYFLVPTKERG